MAFTDAHERTIDAKNRIQIPSQYRTVMEKQDLGDALYLCPGERERTLSLYPERTFLEFAERLRTDQISGEDSLAFEQLYYSLASRLEMDKQGRVVLPERQLSLVQLGKDVTLTGSNTRIDVWRTEDYQAFLGAAYNERWRNLQKFMRGMPQQSNPSNA